MKDMIIIGGGPAGVACAVEGKKLGLDVLLLEMKRIGGYGLHAGEILFEGKKISPEELEKNFTRKLEEADVEVIFDRVTSGSLVGNEKKVKTASGESYFGKTVVIAGGGSPREAGFDNPKGLGYTALGNEEEYAGKDVILTGNSPWLGKISTFLKEKAASVTVLQGEDEVLSLEGEKEISTIRYRLKGEEKTVESPVLYVFNTLLPNTDIYIRMDMEEGFIETTDVVETNIPGVFASGDIRVKERRDVKGAMEDGIAAARACKEYLG